MKLNESEILSSQINETDQSESEKLQPNDEFTNSDSIHINGDSISKNVSTLSSNQK